jgi:hypothetical protein
MVPSLESSFYCIPAYFSTYINGTPHLTLVGCLSSTNVTDCLPFSVSIVDPVGRFAPICRVLLWITVAPNLRRPLSADPFSIDPSSHLSNCMSSCVIFGVFNIGVGYHVQFYYRPLPNNVDSAQSHFRTSCGHVCPIPLLYYH